LTIGEYPFLIFYLETAMGFSLRFGNADEFSQAAGDMEKCHECIVGKKIDDVSVNPNIIGFVFRNPEFINVFVEETFGIGRFQACAKSP
jgi:hypothetical protein